MHFSKAYKVLRKAGPKTIKFKSQGADFVDVWASELLSGKRKGAPVIRIQWGNSSSTLDESQWMDSKKDALMRRVQSVIEATLADI